MRTAADRPVKEGKEEKDEKDEKGEEEEKEEKEGTKKHVGSFVYSCSHAKKYVTASWPGKYLSCLILKFQKTAQIAV